MSILDRAEICYLLIFPDPAEKTSEPLQQISGLKDAPYFQPVDVRVRTLAEGVEVQAGGVQVAVLRQHYDDRIQILDCRFPMPDALSLKAIQQREIIEKNLRERFLPAEHLKSGMFEEYIVLLLENAKPTPDKFIAKNSTGLARFMRSQREVFDPREIEEILVSRVRYSNMDLTLVDWDGAVIIAPNGDFQSDIELLKIGNYQLLRYRMLDKSIEIMLDKISKTFFENKRRPRPTRGMIRQIAEHKLEVMLDFERTEQNLLLIGDWYTAKLYETIQSEFYLKDWKENLKNKLNNLEGIVQTIKDNFSLSLESVWARIEMLAWALMLIGYMYLTFVDLGLIKK
jgi:hypothetical protein